ncbi:MAG: hypothetical protein K2O45_00500 [Oscillospiraceae bacterium]|nr:hypothetical protein [Oscillospiraceae bacterium]
MGNPKPQIRTYLLFVEGICFLLGITAGFTGNSDGNIAYQILQKGFTAFPVIAAVMTRRITKDAAEWHISLKVWKNPLLWLFCAVVPNILITICL